MKNQFNIHKEIGDFKNNFEEQGATPYISISDCSNMQVESSHFSINNKNSSPRLNNPQNLVNHNNNNNLVSSNSGFLSLSKSIINNNISNSHNNNNNSGVQLSFENVSFSGSNKLQISSNSIIFKKQNDISKNSIFLSPSTLCNYYQQSNDVTPYKSPLMKQPENEHELIHENDQSSGKEMHKLKQINIDFLHKRKNTVGGGNNSNKNININNININSNLNNLINNNCEITSRSDECSLDNNKTLSSQRKYLFDKKTPIKYAKNQLKSGEKNKSSKSNNSKLENNNSNSNIFENKNNNFEEEIKNRKKGIAMIQNKNGRNLMDTFEKVGNDKENDDNLKFFNNRRQPTEIHVPSEEININNNNEKIENNNINKNFIDRLDEDSSFMEKDNNINNKSNNEIEEVNFLEKIKNSLNKEKNEEKNINNNNINNYNNNFNIKNEKIEKNKEDLNKENKENNNKEIKETNTNNINFKKEDCKKICIKKMIPSHKKENNNNNITELSKNIIKELSRANSNKRKDSRRKSRPSSFTKNIIINFNSFNSIGLNNNNNNNIENIIGFKNKKNSNILVKKPKYNNEFRNTNDIFGKKPKIKLINKNNNHEGKQTNNTLEPLNIRRKIKIPNNPRKKEKYSKEISISNITNINKDKKRPPSSENYNRRATSFSNLKQNINNNLFQNNNINVNNNISNHNRNNSKKNSNSSNCSGQNNINKNHSKKQKPLIVNLFVEQDSKQIQKNINEHLSHNHQQNSNNDLNNNSIKNNPQEKIHKIIKKKMKPLVSKKEKEKDVLNTNSIINNHTNDRNFQTVSSSSRNALDIKIKNKLNDKKDNEDIGKKKDKKLNKSLFNSELNNNNINIKDNNLNDNKSNINYNLNNNNAQLKKKEETKVKIIQNFSSYHKIKYKSHISEKINFAETQPKQFSLAQGFYNCSKINNANLNKENKKYNNNTYQQIRENNENDLSNEDKTDDKKEKHIKFRKLEKLPGDSDSGDVDLND